MSSFSAVVLSSIGIRVVSAGLLFATSIVLAKWLGPENYGMYALVLSTASVIAIPVSAGLPSLLTRETARSVREGDLSYWKGLLSFAVTLVGLVSLGGVALFLAYYAYSGREISRFGGYFVMVVALVPLIALDRIRGAVMHGLGSALLAQVPEALMRPALYFIIVLCGLQLFSGDSLRYAIICYGATAALSFLFGSMLLRQMMRGQLKGIKAKYNTKIWTVALFSLGGLSASQTLVGNADIILLGLFGSAMDAGIYKVALQGVALMLIAQTGISAVLSTRLARGFAANSVSEIVRVSDGAAILFFATSALAMLAFASIGDLAIYRIFGPEYGRAGVVLLVLSAGQLVNAATGPTMTILVMSRNEKSALLGVLSGGVITGALAFCLIPWSGPEGMALSSACGVVIANVLMALAVRSRVGFDPTLLGAISRALNRTRAQ